MRANAVCMPPTAAVLGGPRAQSVLPSCCWQLSVSAGLTFPLAGCPIWFCHRWSRAPRARVPCARMLFHPACARARAALVACVRGRASNRGAACAICFFYSSAHAHAGLCRVHTRARSTHARRLVGAYGPYVICVHTYTYAYIHICIRMFAGIYAFGYTYAFVYTYTYIHALYMHTYVRMLTGTDKYAHAAMHRHIHTCIHIHA